MKKLLKRRWEKIENGRGIAHSAESKEQKAKSKLIVRGDAQETYSQALIFHDGASPLTTPTFGGQGEADTNHNNIFESVEVTLCAMLSALCDVPYNKKGETVCSLE